MDNLDHPFNFLRRDRPGAALFPQQVHYVSGEFVTGLKQTKTKRWVLPFINHPKGDAKNLRHSLRDKLLIKNVNCFWINLGTSKLVDMTKDGRLARHEGKYYDQRVRGKVER